jgi:putative transposase
MREAGLSARPKTRRRVVTTDSNHAEPIAPNRLARQFDVHGEALNQVRVGDITYIPTREGFLYLSTVLDLGSRRCVGWATRDTMEVDLVTSALRMAREARQPASGLIFHSDRGSQYASEAYRTELAAHGMLASMSAKGDCYDNAVAESFFATLEFELVMTHDWHTQGGRATGDLPVYRDVVQPAATVFDLGVRQSGGVPSAVTEGRVVPFNYVSTFSG